jgi:FlaA1/EpsC-like NDP-sugar epimerase
MRRYFMTIPEAVQLVLQAGALGRGGELFMLDMGEQVRIVDLARDLIRLSGLEVDVDIEIQYTGMRPGEKLFEEMFFEHEHATRTDHPKVLRARDQLEYWGMEQVNELIAVAMNGADDRTLLTLLRGIVPDFTPDDMVEPPVVTIERAYRGVNPKVSDLLRAPRPGLSQDVTLSKNTSSRQPEL